MGSLMGSLVTSTMSYLPTVVQDMCLQSRSFATCRLPGDNTKSVCGFATIRGQQCVVVACSDGYLYIYEFDPDKGGVLPLLKQHDLDQQQKISEVERSSDGSVS